VRVPRFIWQLVTGVFFRDTWRHVDEEAALEREERATRGAGYDLRPMIVFCLAAVLLTAMEYWGMPDTFRALVRALADREGDPTGYWASLHKSPFYGLMLHGWWAGARVTGFFVIPAFAVLLYGDRVRDQGLGLGSLREDAWIYALLFAVMIPVIVGVSLRPEFTSYYPFYRSSRRSWFDLLAWEGMYVAQFFALEFFFRGWLLTSCRSAMGSTAIFAMVVPYVMIHFGKPMIETLAATFAGLILGTMALHSRSIWGGFLVHVGVAVSMDIASLLRTGALPSTWWPAT